jgi:hypothetical protein
MSEDVVLVGPLSSEQSSVHVKSQVFDGTN